MRRLTRPKGWCRWHPYTSPKLWGSCVHCGTAMHVHRPHLTQAQREDRTHLEPCPACHRLNAVLPAHGPSGGIRTAMVEAGQPVMQGVMKGV